MKIFILLLSIFFFTTLFIVGCGDSSPNPSVTDGNPTTSIDDGSAIIATPEQQLSDTQIPEQGPAPSAPPPSSPASPAFTPATDCREYQADCGNNINLCEKKYNCLRAKAGQPSQVTITKCQKLGQKDITLTLNTWALRPGKNNLLCDLVYYLQGSANEIIEIFAVNNKNSCQNDLIQKKYQLITEGYRCTFLTTPTGTKSVEGMPWLSQAG